MKLVKRNYKNIDNSVESIGIENIKLEKLDSIIKTIQESDKYEFLVGTTPFSIISGERKECIFTIDGIDFFKMKNLEEVIKNSSLNSIEEIILIFTKDIKNILILYEKQKNISKGNTGFFSVDPYSNIKNLCLVNNSVLLFYSPGDFDIDLFVKKNESDSLIKVLTTVI